MRNKVSPALIGSFVLGALILGLVALIAFGSFDFFHKRERFLVYFSNESIQGLTRGSPVKLDGVSVGQVVDLRVRYDAATNHAAVAVLCEFTKQYPIFDTSGHLIDVTKPEQLQSLIDHGLRAQLGVLGLATGLLYIDLTFENPRVYPANPVTRNSPYPVIPQIPSTISELATNATEIMNKIKQIDFVGLAGELQALLKTTRERLDGVDLKGLVDQWKTTGDSVNKLVNAPEILQTFRTFDETLAQVRSSLDRVNGQVDVSGKNLQTTLTEAQATLRRFSEAAVTLQRFVASQEGLGASAAQAMTSVSNAADSVQRLADFLERNPNAIVVGRKEGP